MIGNMFEDMFAGSGGGSGLPESVVPITEIPSGAIDGSNRVFLLSQAPAPGTLRLYINGTLLNVPNDYTITGPVITFVVAPQINDKIGATYNVIIGSGPLSFSFEFPVGLINNVNTAYTIAYTPTTGSFTLFRNGQAQQLVDDYTISGKNITMVTAPNIGDSLVANYGILNGAQSGLPSFSNEIPSGDIDGTNTTFELSNMPKSSSLVVYWNGERQEKISNYTVVGTTITMVIPPIVGDSLLASYQY